MSISHWGDYGDSGGRHPFACHKEREFCHCGREMVTTVELTGRYSTNTGEPTHEVFHSCPTWVEGWRTKGWARGWATPGMGHDSHDAENPMSTRGYR